MRRNRVITGQGRTPGRRRRSREAHPCGRRARRLEDATIQVATGKDGFGGGPPNDDTRPLRVSRAWSWTQPAPGRRGPAHRRGVGDHAKSHTLDTTSRARCPCAPPVRFSPETLNAPCPRQHELRAASSAWAEERQRQSHILRPTPTPAPSVCTTLCASRPVRRHPRPSCRGSTDRGAETEGTAGKPRGQQILGTGPSMTKRGPEDHETRAPKRTSRRGQGRMAAKLRSHSAHGRGPMPRAYPTRRRFASRPSRSMTELPPSSRLSPRCLPLPRPSLSSSP